MPCKRDFFPVIMRFGKKKLNSSSTEKEWKNRDAAENSSKDRNSKKENYVRQEKKTENY